MLSLEQKVAIVTGSGSIGPGWGNGKAIAVLFARQGATVVGVDVNGAAASETQGIIQSEGGSSLALACEVTDTDQVRTLVAGCLSRFGRIDVLVNNVGEIGTGRPSGTR